MSKIRILLVCGSGASSGFMAANMRKAAVSRGLDLSIVARGESEIENYIDDIDVLMVGPHLSYLMDATQAIVQGTQIKIILMESSYYATLNGDKAVEHLLKNI
ncbi:MAG: PTS sugar transporter subunit IIB [Erysipelotrichaceae bacterium]|nr:PTS sugar transporter subunit IIB [Erysipelotrichaceae bacterium]